MQRRDFLKVGGIIIGAVVALLKIPAIKADSFDLDPIIDIKSFPYHVGIPNKIDESRIFILVAKGQHG